MNDSKYRWLLNTIAIVILCTIGIQVYWNYKNYEVNKQQLINDVQVSLDDAIEAYYAQMAKNETYNFTFNSHNDTIHHYALDSIRHNIEMISGTEALVDSLDIKMDENFALIKISDGDSVFRGIKRFNRDSIHAEVRGSLKIDSTLPTFGGMLREVHPDSSFFTSFRNLTSRVIISLSSDSLSLKEIDSIFKSQLHKKSINIDYGLKYETFNDRLIYINKSLEAGAPLTIKSTSPYLHFEGGLYAFFTNSTKVILKRILTGILLSTLLVLAVIGCLFYLLNIIKRQKQLAEVKNDFISNITHEFKTPIATIGVALESIKDFNVISDKDKTTSYINMSNNQLNKLNVMVEKLLETASLDSENLRLKKEESNVSHLIQNLVTKHKLDLTDKTLSLTGDEKDINAKIDVFHFENAINNIIDNAIKYGGDRIEVALEQNTIGFTIMVSDNGKDLQKVNQNKIFEKFYRVPKGNTHDVKGFGIGLYYAKKIVEKHEGAIHLSLDNQWTTFKISLPYE